MLIAHLTQYYKSIGRILEVELYLIRVKQEIYLHDLLMSLIIGIIISNIYI